jgi:hypothetical protein
VAGQQSGWHYGGPVWLFVKTLDDLELAGRLLTTSEFWTLVYYLDAYGKEHNL